MYQEQRISKMLTLLDERRELSTQEMMKYFEVSRDTIRRDFSILSERNLVKRTHGGIIPLESSPQILSFNDRIEELTQEKRKIAQKAEKFIIPEKLYFFDVSTIILNIAQMIDVDITIYSHSLDNAIMLSNIKIQIFIYLVGNFTLKIGFIIR